MTYKWLTAGSVLLTLAAAGTTIESQQAATSQRAPVTKAQADRWMTELSNAGRWGKDDQLGALNLVTPLKRQQAMALAKTGTVVSLERRVALVPKPDETKADGKPHGIAFYEIRFKTFPADDPRGNPGFSSDVQEFHVHGGMTHLDALCHESINGTLYNAFPLKETVSEETGCTKLGLDNLESLISFGSRYCHPLSAPLRYPMSAPQRILSIPTGDPSCDWRGPRDTKRILLWFMPPLRSSAVIIFFAGLLVFRRVGITHQESKLFDPRILGSLKADQHFVDSTSVVPRVACSGRESLHTALLETPLVVLEYDTQYQQKVPPESVVPPFGRLVKLEVSNT